MRSDVYLTYVCESSTTILCASFIKKRAISGETSEDLPSSFCAVINRSAVKV